MLERSRRDRPDADDGDGFGEQWFRLGITFRGAGRAEGDLTPECAAALSAVLEALSKKAGPEDSRTLDLDLSAPGVPGPDPAGASLPGAVIRSSGDAMGRRPGPPAAPMSPATRDRLRRALLAMAVDVLSGPGGLAAALRAGLDGPLASVSLPLDVGAATETIPAHLRRAVAVRHPGCASPGCDQPVSVCDVHHIVHRSEGGSTALDNPAPLREFHHLVVVHRWGWRLELRPDGTTTATSPDGRVLSSHGPPGRAA